MPARGCQGRRAPAMQRIGGARGRGTAGEAGGQARVRRRRTRAGGFRRASWSWSVVGRAGTAALGGGAGLGARTAPSASAAAAPGARLYAIRLAAIRRSGVVGAVGGLAATRVRGGDPRGPRRRPAPVVDAHEALLADQPAAAGDLDDVAVDLGHGVVDLVHVRLDDLDEDLLAGTKRQSALLHLLARALERDREVVHGQPVRALEQKAP